MSDDDTDITEFTWLDPQELHLVGTPANRFDEPLLAKSAADPTPLSAISYVALTKAKYDAADLRRLKANGETMPDGDFPVADLVDLHRAIRAVGRGKKASHVRIRKYIIGRAKALGRSDLIPSTWASNGSLLQKEGTVKRKAIVKALDALGVNLAGTGSTVGDRMSSLDYGSMLVDAQRQTRQVHPALAVFEGRVLAAKAALAAADNPYAKTRAETALKEAFRTRCLALMIAKEAAHERGLPRSRMGPGWTDLFGGTTLSIGEDPGIKGWSGGRV